MNQVPDLVTFILNNMQKWLGYVEQMSASKIILEDMPERMCAAKESSLSFLRNLKGTLKRIGVRGWRRHAQDKVEVVQVC